MKTFIMSFKIRLKVKCNEKLSFKQFIALSALLVVALAAPVEEYEHHYQSTTPIPILKYDSKNGHDGSYAFAYETANGINAHEQGFIKNAGAKEEIQVAQGYYTYTGEDGKEVQVHYQADENGFQAVNYS